MSLSLPITFLGFRKHLIRASIGRHDTYFSVQALVNMRNILLFSKHDEHSVNMINSKHDKHFSVQFLLLEVDGAGLAERVSVSEHMCMCVTLRVRVHVRVC